MLKKMFSTELGKGVIVLFITINLFNFLNFLFHFVMGRMLGPADYGVLAVLMSMIYIYNAPAEAIQNIISRYASKFNLKKEYGKIKFLINKSLKKAIKVSIYLFLFSILMAFFLSEFLEINFWLIFVTNIYIFFIFSVPIIRGVLQGRKKFSLLGFGMISESVLKLSSAILLVILGFKVFGAMMGVLIGVSIGMIISFNFNKEIIKKKAKEIKFEGIYFESIPYFITMLIIFIALSLDIILVKRFFNPELAGQYSVLSMLGKMVFFGTMAIGKAMFPLTSEKHDNNKNPSALFKKSLIIITIICLIAVLIFLFFPKLVIKILYGNQYISMAPYLVYSGISLSFLSLTNLIFIYGLSTKKIKKPHYLFIFLIIEILLLFSFNNSILEYLLAFMFSNIIMFIGSLLLMRKWEY